MKGMKVCKRFGCNNTFIPSRITQEYCRSRICQKSRKRAWQKQKLLEDSDYRISQQEAQKRWQAKRPDYWKGYRAKHPSYVSRNRRLQHIRNGRRAPKDSTRERKIAKMDAKLTDFSGTYYLFPVSSCGELPDLIAKMDAELVSIQSVTPSGGKKRVIAKRGLNHS